MKKVVIDARRPINSGIGRVSQWLVENLEEKFFENMEIWYLTRREIHDYNFKSEKIIYTKAKPFTAEDFYRIPCLLKEKNFDLYLNPLTNSSPIHEVPTINIIHDFWALENIKWLPNISDLKSRFELSDLLAINHMASWLTEEKAKNYLTDIGYKKWKTSLEYNNIIFKCAWSQATAIASSASHICFVSHQVKNIFTTLFKRIENISLIPNGINENWKKVKRKKGKHFLNLSKLEERKNIHGLLDAYEIYAKNIQKPYPLILAGDPGYEGYAKSVISRIKELNKLNFNINFYPSVKDETIITFFEEAIALLFPSYYEGYGLPPLEAMAAGVPVVTSKTGIMQDKFKKYVTLLEKNTPEELADIMIKITTNKVFYDDLAKVAKQAFELDKSLKNEYIRNLWVKLINKLLCKSNLIKSKV